MIVRQLFTAASQSVSFWDHCPPLQIVVLMKAKEVQQSQQYYLSYTFIFDGEGTTGTYLGS